MIAVINIIKKTILIIAKITTTMGVSYGKECFMFVAKKIVALIDIQTMNIKKKRTLKIKPRIPQT